MEGEIAKDSQDGQVISSSGSSRLLRYVKNIGRFVLSQYITIGFGISCLLAYYFPWVAAHGGTIRSEYSILYGAVAFIFLVSGLQLAPEKMKANLTNWRLHIIVQGMSFLIIPAIMLAIIHISIAAGALTSHTPSVPILIGMLVTACIPTTIASNVLMTRSAGGDDAAAIISVVIGNVAGSFLSPLLIFTFFPKHEDFRPWKPASAATLGRMYADVAKQLGLSVLLPLVVGQLVRRWKEGLTVRALESFKLAKVSSFCLVLLVWTTFSGAFQTGALFLLPKASILFNIFMNVALYLLFTILCFYLARPPNIIISCLQPRDPAFKSTSASKKLINISLCRIPRRMSKEETIAVCFCGAAKTTSLGVPLAAAMWARADDLTRAYIQIPVLLYTIEQVFLAQLLVLLFRWYLKRGRKPITDDSIDNIEESRTRAIV